MSLQNKPVLTPPPHLLLVSSLWQNFSQKKVLRNSFVPLLQGINVTPHPPSPFSPLPNESPSCAKSCRAWEFVYFGGGIKTECQWAGFLLFCVFVFFLFLFLVLAVWDVIGDYWVRLNWLSSTNESYRLINTKTYYKTRKWNLC